MMGLEPPKVSQVNLLLPGPGAGLCFRWLRGRGPSLSVPQVRRTLHRSPFCPRRSFSPAHKILCLWIYLRAPRLGVKDAGRRRSRGGSGLRVPGSCLHVRTKAPLATGRQLGDRSGVFLGAGRGPRPPPPSLPSAFRESLRMANGVGLNKPTETGEEPPPSQLGCLVTRPRPSGAHRASRKGWGHGHIWEQLALGRLTFAPIPRLGRRGTGVLPPAGGGGEREASGACLS